MADRAYNNGVVVGATLNAAASSVKRGAVAAGKGVVRGSKGAKDATTSFWAGLKSGLRSPNQQIGNSVPKDAVDMTSRIIVVQKI